MQSYVIGWFDMESAVTVAGSSVKAVFQALLERKVSQSLIEERVGVRLDELDDQDARVALGRFHQLWELALEQTGDPALGLHLGEQLDMSRMGVIGHIVFNNRTLGRALQQYVRLAQVANEGVAVSLRDQDGLAVLEWHCERPEYYSIPNMDRTMALAITRARRFVSEKLYLERVTFQHEKPDYAPEYERIFGCPVLFGQPSCSIVFRRHYLDYELPQRNPYLHQILTRHVERLLRRLAFRNTLSHKVKGIVSKHLSLGELDAEVVAEQLHMSRHTLYRKLKQEGQSFQGLVEEVRKEKAIRYLKEDRYALSEIAFLLGFSELSAFSRAFKRWTGESPANYRQNRKAKESKAKEDKVKED